MRFLRSMPKTPGLRARWSRTFSESIVAGSVAATNCGRSRHARDTKASCAPILPDRISDRRQAPDVGISARPGNGEQMDFVEAGDLNGDGLIQRHCVYWGWFGFRVLQRDEYRRSEKE
jgi:hypothetical protein